ncbi:hypothetical protein SAMN02745219_02456 [Desulfofundulus thermosubterraneus DSM 16057]|uniref:Uncharacterized protein n=1 Tax=Desulfofundulus thermosubterraneus DSM 16057 TaxID=1121432 RepID=A0A1M6IZ04_9FIRM|nr:hypothetical protein SAMN02745219_02456 [Desulfofundulus thermosubterraneus DSM 16057]
MGRPAFLPATSLVNPEPVDFLQAIEVVHFNQVIRDGTQNVFNVQRSFDRRGFTRSHGSVIAVSYPPL